MKNEEPTEIVTNCHNCGEELDEPVEFDGQGEVWCDACIEEWKKREPEEDEEEDDDCDTATNKGSERDS